MNMEGRIEGLLLLLLGQNARSGLTFEGEGSADYYKSCKTSVRGNHIIARH